MDIRNSITINALNPVIGAEILGVDLREGLADTDIQIIQDALDSHQVIFFRDQDISTDQQLAFGRRFGELHVHPSVRGLDRAEWTELLPVHADAKTGRIAGDKWHADVSSDEKPPYASILHLTKVPPSGGDTLFSSTHRAYEMLSGPMKKMLGGLTALHDGGPNYKDRELKNRASTSGRAESTAVHPVITTHPRTGRKAIYVNPIFTKRIIELPEAESDAILAFLYGHTTRPEFQCRFRWERNSIAFWDNRAVLHYATWDYYPEERSGQRVTVRGDRPV